MNYALIKKLSLQDQKTLLQRMVKLQEEAGELAQEVLIDEKASGSLHKEAGSDGILGECVDVVLVVLSIYFSKGGNEADLEKYIEYKCSKWEKNQTTLNPSP
ncbi:MAG: hypothetical protein WCK42_00080 [Myxococcaceae bacterium]